MPHAADTEGGVLPNFKKRRNDMNNEEKRRKWTESFEDNDKIDRRRSFERRSYRKRDESDNEDEEEEKTKVSINSGDRKTSNLDEKVDKHSKHKSKRRKSRSPEEKDKITKQAQTNGQEEHRNSKRKSRGESARNSETESESSSLGTWLNAAENRQLSPDPKRSRSALSSDTDVSKKSHKSRSKDSKSRDRDMRKQRLDEKDSNSRKSRDRDFDLRKHLDNMRVNSRKSTSREGDFDRGKHSYEREKSTKSLSRDRDTRDYSRKSISRDRDMRKRLDRERNDSRTSHDRDKHGQRDVSFLKRQEEDKFWKPPDYDPNEKFTFFFTKKYPFSNHYPCEQLKISKLNFSCTEQYYMYMKAITFDDKKAAEDILKSSDPKEMKSIGSRIKSFDASLWDAPSRSVLMLANLQKYQQNRKLRMALFKTHGTTLVETNPSDNRWGIALHMDDKRAQNRRQWRGQNWMGEILNKVRDALWDDPKYKDEVEKVKKRMEKQNIL